MNGWYLDNIQWNDLMVQMVLTDAPVRMVRLPEDMVPMGRYQKNVQWRQTNAFQRRFADATGRYLMDVFERFGTLQLRGFLRIIL